VSLEGLGEEAHSGQGNLRGESSIESNGSSIGIPLAKSHSFAVRVVRTACTSGQSTVRPGADFVSLGKVSKGGLDKKNTFFGHVGFFRTRGFQPLTLEQLYNNVLGHA
jgi:hypothetical protein